MVKKIYEFISTHGMTLMISGFIFSVAGLLFYMQTRSSIAFGCTFAGFGVYVVGRIGVAINRHKAKKKPQILGESNDGDDAS